MSSPCRIALLGLSPADRSVIEPLFHQAPDTDPPCDCEPVQDLHLADLIIANADDPNTVHTLQARQLPAAVLLMGASDAGTGWPVVARPIQWPAVLQAVGRLTQQPSGSAPRRIPAPTARHPEPAFEATVPFAPLEMTKASGAGAHQGFDVTRPFSTVPGAPLEMTKAPGAGAYQGFDVTQPFDRSAAGDLVPHSPVARPAVQDDTIDMRSVLMWRDAQAGPPATPSIPAGGAPAAPAGLPAEPRIETAPAAGPEPGFPGLAGFESTRDADHPEHPPVPANWRELAQQQAQARRLAAPPAPPAAPGHAGLSSSFADPADHPTLPPAVALSGKRPVILLVGAARLAESSLIRALRGFGYPVDYVEDGEAARSRLATQAYGFAFLDDVSLGRQTVPLCRALRKRARALGQQQLRVVVIARKGGPLRRLWARMTGCDAWMTLPLDRKRLGQYLRG
jgi:CheY-like chemotaxis protein